jgi:beta propeller repeat protein/parallel beta-helix repeat protein
MLKTGLVILLLLSSACIGVCTAAEVAVCTAASDQINPDVDGQYVVWEDHRVSPWRVYLYNNRTRTSERVPLSADGVNQVQPAVSGDAVVYVSTTATGYQVCLFSIADRTTTIVRSSTALLEWPDVYATGEGVAVVWTEYVQNDPYGAANSEIWLYKKPRVGFKTTTRVRDGYESSPRVSGDWIVWMHKTETPGLDSYHGPYDVYARKVSGGDTVLVSTTTAGDRNLGPDVSEGRVVWQDSDEIDEYGADVLIATLPPPAAGPAVFRSAASATRVCRAPSISGGAVVWVDSNLETLENEGRATDTGEDIWYYLGASTHVSRPRVAGTTVVWQDNRAGNWDIYLAAMAPTPISGCTSIDDPGYYILSADIIDSTCPVALRIQSSNVFLDGRGHLIDGRDWGGTQGIRLMPAGSNPSLENIRIEDLRLTDWEYGIWGGLSSTCSFSDLLARSGVYGISLDVDCHENKLSSGTVVENSADGILAADDAGLIVRNSTIARNGGDGVSGFMAGIECHDSLIAENGRHGFYGDHAGGDISGCTIRDNGDSGIYLNYNTGGTIAGNIITGNAIGIHDAQYPTDVVTRTIYNNLFNNTVNVDTVSPSAWNVTERPGPNIVGGPSIGGNYWGQPDGLGFSQTHADADGDGFCDQAFTVPPSDPMFTGGTDRLPLADLAADFKGEPRVGYAPLSVQFSDGTTGHPTAWAWAFGDGGTSTTKDPHHLYLVPGTYTVSLEASGPVLTDAVTKVGYIHVLPASGPFTIQAEDYDWGGAGISYHDTSPGNQGGVYRDDDVDISPFEKGYVISHIVDGEWTEYQVPGPAATNHACKLTLRVSTRTTGERVTIEVEGFDKVTADLPDTGSLSVFTDVMTIVTLRPGMNTLRFSYDGDYTNFDYFTLDPGDVAPLVAVPGGAGVPRDLDGDGTYEDVNGNGRKDFADITLYFNQMAWIGANEPLAAFDYNGNGRIDFADVAWLFTRL